MKQSKLEKLIDKTNINFTDKIEYFPCRADQPRTVYLDYSWFYIKKEPVSLIVAIADVPYIEMVSRVLEGLTGKKLKNFYKLPNPVRKKLYELISDNMVYWRNYGNINDFGQKTINYSKKSIKK